MIQPLFESSNGKRRQCTEHKVVNHDIHLLHHNRTGETAIKLKPEENKDKSLEEDLKKIIFQVFEKMKN